MGDSPSDLTSRLEAHLTSVQAQTKREIVVAGYQFLTEQMKLQEEEALHVLSKKIDVRSTKAVKFHLSPGRSDPTKRVGRPAIIGSSKFEDLRKFILSEYQSARYLTMDDIVNRLLSDGTLDYIDGSTLQHNLKDAGFRSVLAKPQEPGRIQLTTTQINSHFQALSLAIQNIPARLIINADESGFQPWIDSKEVRVWVPTSHAGDAVQVAIDRQTKRVSLLAGIALSGATIRPLVIIPRKSFGLELAGLGYTDFAIFVESAKGYISQERFRIWLTKAVGPYLQEVRRDIGEPNARALLIIDGCTAHENLDVLCSELNLELFFLPAHGSHLFQPLDLVTFGIQKRRYAQLRLESPKLNKMTQNIHRILFSFQQAATSSNNVSAFRRAGIVLTPTCSDSKIYLRGTVDRTYAMKAMQYLASPECHEADGASASSGASAASVARTSEPDFGDPLDDILGGPIDIMLGAPSVLPIFDRSADPLPGGDLDLYDDPSVSLPAVAPVITTMPVHVAPNIPIITSMPVHVPRNIPIITTMPVHVSSAPVISVTPVQNNPPPPLTKRTRGPAKRGPVKKKGKNKSKQRVNPWATQSKSS